MIRLRVAFVACIAVLLLWEVAGRNSYRTRLLLSFPSRLIEYSQIHAIGLLQDFAYTASVALVGFLLAVASGAVLASMGFKFPTLRRSTVHSLQMLQVVPVLVFAPFVTMVFGVGFFAHIVIAFLVGIFPFTSILLDALARIPEPYYDLVRMHRLKFLVALQHVFLPLCASAIFAGARVTISVCVVGATVAEFTGSRLGLGKNVFEAAIRIEPEMLMMSTLGIIVIGIAGIGILRTLEARYVKWKP